MITRRQPWQIAGWVALLFMLLMFPITRPPIYVMHVMFMIFLYVTLASSWNFIAGFTGYADFGKLVYFGLGAYFTAILHRDFGWTPLLTFPLAGLFGGVVAAILGWIMLRLRGDYFAIASLAFLFICELIASHIGFTGGGMGILLTPPAIEIWLAKALFYEVMLAIAVMTSLVGYWISTSGFGYGLRAIRESESIAEVVGVPTTKLKVLAYVLSSLFPAMAGGVFAFYISYIDAFAVFNIVIALNMKVMAILGGIGTFGGPILGAVLLASLAEVLAISIVNEGKLVVFGLVLIIAMLLLPNGILGIWTKRHLPRAAAVVEPAVESATVKS